MMSPTVVLLLLSVSAAFDMRVQTASASSGEIAQGAAVESERVTRRKPTRPKTEGVEQQPPQPEKPEEKKQLPTDKPTGEKAKPIGGGVDNPHKGPDTGNPPPPPPPGIDQLLKGEKDPLKGLDDPLKGLGDPLLKGKDKAPVKPKTQGQL